MVKSLTILSSLKKLLLKYNRVTTLYSFLLQSKVTQLHIYIFFSWASMGAQSVKNLPAIQEALVRSLSQEDPLEKEMATHFSILA